MDKIDKKNNHIKIGGMKNEQYFGWIGKKSYLLAIAAAPFAHLGNNAPLLWTDREKMPDAVMGYLKSIQPKYKKSPTECPYNHAWLTGGDDQLTAKVPGQIDSMLEIKSATREGHGMPGLQDNNQDSGMGGHDMSNMPCL